MAEIQSPVKVTIPIYTRTNAGEFIHLGDAEVEVPLDFSDSPPVPEQSEPPPVEQTIPECISCGKPMWPPYVDTVCTGEGFRHQACAKKPVRA